MDLCVFAVVCIPFICCVQLSFTRVVDGLINQHVPPRNDDNNNNKN